jgi:hypothetical protein
VIWPVQRNRLTEPSAFDSVVASSTAQDTEGVSSILRFDCILGETGENWTSQIATSQWLDNANCRGHRHDHEETTGTQNRYSFLLTELETLSLSMPALTVETGFHLTQCGNLRVQGCD